MDDTIIQYIETFRCPRATLLAERRNRGYTIYNARSGTPLARLRTTDAQDSFEVPYWSLGKQRCTATGPFGRTTLPLNEALQLIISEDIFWVTT